MASKAQQVWDGLNDRQRTYLQVLFGIDQGLEKEHHHDLARGHIDRRTARTRRRIHFNDQRSPVVRALHAVGVYDSGAGAALAALADRDLAEVDSVPDLIPTRLGGHLLR
ncbi:hypothetical protein ACIA8O_37055 [Kitasatospora sp. NPDC051853]|uniref:hypothetical protein n=1 Tax=Kitasatospora sp. NPDC051853 TaxID=3364058 RepID=UPI00379B8E7D